ncbi:hypothetical protein P4238_02060 [Pseudomonas aeruginosa]|nr:hypothetical protein [Pseudomonas aeruginosa]
MSVPVRHLIAGAFVEGLGAQRIPVSNPLDNSTLAEIACASAEQIEQAVASAPREPSPTGRKPRFPSARK